MRGTNMSLHVRWRRARTAAIGAAVVGLLAAGCGDSGGGSSTPDDTLVAYNGQSGDYQAIFNPYLPNPVEGAGTIFEPLFYYNTVRADDPQPLLGTDYEWNEDGTELAITLREGVKWSDGEPFSAEDVKFTFDMIVANEAMNAVGFEGETTVVDDTHVTISFDEPSYMDGPQLLGKTWIVPKHIWEGIDDPTTDPVAEPVGTGPYTLSSFKPQAFTLAANENYWGGQPELKNIQYVALSGNQASADALSAGEIDWQTGPVPDIANVERDYPGYKAITVPMNQVVLDTCSNPDLGCEGPQTDPAVRHAIYYAMDRTQLNSLAFQNTASEMSPGFALPERDAAYLSAQLEDRTAPMNPDVQKAQEVLEEAGWTRGSDGIYAKDGQKLSLSCIVVAGWNDYITALQTLTEQLKEVGIELNVQQVANQEMSDARSAGNFQLLIDSLWQGPSPDPYYLYSYFFSSNTTAEVGSNANPNWARYSNEAVDEALEAIARLNPEDSEARQPYYDTIQQQIEEDMPYIPVLTGGTTSEFNAEKFDGWPTDVNLYAFPAVWSRPDQAQIFKSLTPRGE